MRHLENGMPVLSLSVSVAIDMKWVCCQKMYSVTILLPESVFFNIEKWFQSVSVKQFVRESKLF